MKLSIVMPCYKGESFIGRSIDVTMNEVSKFEGDFELIVVVDGMLDGTYDICRSLEEKHRTLRTVGYPENRGKGYAIERGVRESKGELVAFLDSDLDYHPKSLELFLDILNGRNADFVVGNRRSRESIYRYPLVRKIASQAFNVFINLIFPFLKIRDTQAGIKLVRKKCIDEILNSFEGQENTQGFIFDIYLLVLARKLRFKIAEAPCIFSMASTTIGTGANFIKLAFRMGRDAWRLKTYYDRSITSG